MRFKTKKEMEASGVRLYKNSFGYEIQSDSISEGAILREEDFGKEIVNYRIEQGEGVVTFTDDVYTFVDDVVIGLPKGVIPETIANNITCDGYSLHRQTNGSYQVACQDISKKQALKIFKALGKDLGYDIQG